MEGTHCTLQLQAPITELCYISFYLPKGEVRGFSYKGTVTLDKSNKGFHSCYQVREGSDISSLNLQPTEHPGDIFFKQTPTKDILTELYKLTAERERLLASLLSSDHILSITMGNQEGKLPELSVSLASEDDSFSSAGDWQGEPPVGCLNKRRAHGNKKLRRFGGRRENTEELLQPQRTRRKQRERQDSASQLGKVQICSSNSQPLSSARPDLRLLEERSNLLPNGVLISSPLRRESCPLDTDRMLDVTPGRGGFRMTSEEAGLRLEPSFDCSEVDPREGSAEELQRAPPREASLSTRHKDPSKQPPEAEKGRREKCTQRTCRKKPVSKVVAKVQNLPAQVHRVVKTHSEGDGGIAFRQAAQAEFIPRADFLTLPDAETGTQHSAPGIKEQQRGDESSLPAAREQTLASAEAAVNKVLRKVIESEKLDEATEGKRLGFPVKSLTLPGPRSKRIAGLPQGVCATLLLDQPSSRGSHFPQPQPGGDEDRQSSTPPELAAFSVTFNNSSSQFGAHKRMPPVPLPLSAGLLGPPEHRRSLQLPPLLGEGEASPDDFASAKSSAVFGTPSADTLEPPSSARVTETEGATSSSLQAGQPQLVPGESLGQSLGPGKTTARPQCQSPPGISSEGFPREYFSEQAVTKDLSNRDGSAWVLGYRAGATYPFLLHEEREKPNRSELYLDLHHGTDYTASLQEEERALNAGHLTLNIKHACSNKPPRKA